MILRHLRKRWSNCFSSREVPHVAAAIPQRYEVEQLEERMLLTSFFVSPSGNDADAGTLAASVSGGLPNSFWTTPSPLAGGSDINEVGNKLVAKVVNEGAYNSRGTRSESTSDAWNFFDQSVTWKVRGLDVSSVGSTNLPGNQMNNYFTVMTSTFSGYTSNDSVSVRFKGDGQLALLLNKDTDNNWGTSAGAVTDTNITGFDLTLGPGTAGNVDYTLTAAPSGQVVANGAWAMTQADWSDGGDGSQSYVQIFAQESQASSVDLTQQFELEVDSYEIIADGQSILLDEFDNNDLATVSDDNPYVPRNNYGARFEPVGQIIHGGGQASSSPNANWAAAFQNYSDFVANGGASIPLTSAEYGPIGTFGWAQQLANIFDAREAAGHYTVPQIGMNITENALPTQAELDNMVEKLSLFDRPIYLRIGFEMNGTWKNYDPALYRQSFQIITDRIRAEQLPIATLWNVIPAWGADLDQASWDRDTDSGPNIQDFYPGDEYVDWFSIDIFKASAITADLDGDGVSEMDELLNAAHAAGKPVMIAEHTPQGFGADDASDWDASFAAFFELIQNSPGIKGHTYINWDWGTDPATGNPDSNWPDWGDARLETADPFVQQNYLAELSNPFYVGGGTGRPDFLADRELSFSIADNSIREVDGAAATTAMVTRAGDLSAALTVTLASSDTGEATLPATITIAAGQTTSPSFNINAVDDGVNDATQTVTLTASADDFESGTTQITVSDILSHRMSNLTVVVQDQFGDPLPGATIDVAMTQHEFQFGTQVQDRFLTITETEFNGLAVWQRHHLIGDWNQVLPTPVWQDALNYRNAVWDNFNHIIPTNGMQWIQYRNTGPVYLDTTILEAQSRGVTTTGHAVVWQNDGWPTPNEYRPGPNLYPQGLYDDLIDERLSSNGIMTRFSDSGAGPNVLDWDVLNEPLHEKHYSNTFIGAGIYPNENAVFADYFIRADALRPDANLAVNDYNILSSGGDAAARQYRDLVNDLLALGAPIDQIKVQAHMARIVSKADITRRLDILAETGLPIAISEFDMRDDSNQISPANQEILFRDMLEAVFEHPSVDGFSMWGIWDSAHWRGNGPLYDGAWNVKPEAAPWFDLVRGDWMLDFSNQPLDMSAQWIAPAGLFNGSYKITATHNGGFVTVDDYELTADGTLILTIDRPAAIIGQGVAYGGSAFGDTVDLNKQALLPNETSSSSNFTNFAKGLNRVVIDIDSLPATALSNVDDFEFRVGNTADLSGWLLLDGASLISLPTVSVVNGPSAGVSRVILSWPDNAIENGWLQVTVKATANTGLAADDVFYFGNQVGDVNGDVNIDNQIRVNSFDTGLVRLNQSPVNTVGLENVYDVDRNGLVNSFDTGRVRLNQTLGGLLMFTAPLNNPPAAPPGGGADNLIEVNIAPSAVISTTTISQSQRGYLSRLITRWNDGFREDLSAERRRELTLRRLKRIAQRFSNAAATFASTGDRRAARRDQMALIVNSIVQQIESNPTASPDSIFDSWTNPVEDTPV